MTEFLQTIESNWKFNEDRNTISIRHFFAPHSEASMIARSLVSDCTGITAFPIHAQSEAHRRTALHTTRQDPPHSGPGTQWDWKFEIDEYTDALGHILGLCIWCPYVLSIRCYKSKCFIFCDFMLYWNWMCSIVGLYFHETWCTRRLVRLTPRANTRTPKVFSVYLRGILTTTKIYIET